MSNRKIHLVGSVPMSDAEEVFLKTSSALGDKLPRIPDGETGECGTWIEWLEPVFQDHPFFEPSENMFQIHPSAPKIQRYSVIDGVSFDDIHFEELGYAKNAIASYEVFSRLKAEGKILPKTKFQVDMVPAHSIIWLFVEDRDQVQIDSILNEAVKLEIDRIAAAIPHDELSIQIDVAAAVFSRLEKNETSPYGSSKEETLEKFANIISDLGDRVPSTIDLLFHFCYGDADHKHIIDPTDMTDMVNAANLLKNTIKRHIDLIHMPVPRDRTDEAYFSPLGNLKLDAATVLCLGLVHYTDGLEGSKKRLAAAQQFVTDFAIGTECGFGRRPPETIPDLLTIHAELSEVK